MYEHPFIESAFYRGVALASVGVLAGINTYILLEYGPMDAAAALTGSLAMTIVEATAGFLLWYVTGAVQAVQVQTALALLVQAAALAGSYLALSGFGLLVGDKFVSLLPLLLLSGTTAWIILYQWYRIYRMKETAGEPSDRLPEETADSSGEPETNDAGGSTSTDAAAVPDRISVKDGNRIHIIHPDEIYYIQAGGDYVTFFTATGQYLKEQTLKYYEDCLAASGFVRIHRSCIVNLEQIVRVELFGKETYQVRLKNGVGLRASANGYKLLKERLAF